MKPGGACTILSWKPDPCFWVAKIKLILDASGNFFGQASLAQLGLRFSLFESSTYLGFGGVMGPHVSGVKKESVGPNRPRDAHDVGCCWGGPNATTNMYEL